MSRSQRPTPAPQELGPGPEVLFALTLVASVVIWLPSLLAVISGDLALTTSIVRYVIGLIFSWVAIHAVSLLLRTYAKANAPEAPPADDTPRRRASDRYTIEGDAPVPSGNPTLGHLVPNDADDEFATPVTDHWTTDDSQAADESIDAP